MRSELLDPLASTPGMPDALVLANEIYVLHEAGADYSDLMRKFAQLIGRPIHLHEVRAAFSSIRPETFAKKLLTNWSSLPIDATEAEMLEMIERICNGSGSEFQTEYWLQCLQLNTGDQRISDLIFWPEMYLEREVQDDLSAKEILEIALQKRDERHAV